MKKVALPLFVAGALFLAACGGEKKTEATAETTDSTAVTEEGAVSEEATTTEDGAAPAEQATPEASTSGSTSGSSKSSATTTSKKEEAASTKKIVPTALEIGRFTQLAKCVEATGLGGELGSDGPITLFAPNDEAFAKIPGISIDEYLKPANKAKLIKVLALHVTKGNATLDDMAGAPAFLTSGGKSIKVKKTDKGFTVGKANVVKGNIKCSNGMIHEIDAVLLPSDY